MVRTRSTRPPARRRARRAIAALLATVGLLAAPAAVSSADDGNDDQAEATADGWAYESLFTVGDSIDDYTPPGVLDGLHATRDGDHVVVVANHELTPGSGPTYTLANGTELDGARVSRFVIDAATHEVVEAGPAFDAIINRAGQDVDDPGDLDNDGLSRLCSAHGYDAGEYGFVDDLFLTGEEGTDGTEFALDLASGDLWALPDLGRAAWENVTALDTGTSTHVALLVGDDNADAPLYLYVGEKDPDGNFPARNGLVGGQLHVWVPNGANAPTSPQEFNGTGRTRRGRFVPIDARDAGRARLDGYDQLGYKDAATLRAEARAMGAFFFSRPEDVATNPANPDQAVLADTGRGRINPADDWGGVYEIETSFPRDLARIVDRGRPLSAMVEILYDADDTGDLGLRSPDNLDWADDGFVYVQEDRATQLDEFGGESGRDASIWQLDPRSSEVTQLAEVTGGDELGQWETSGILDVTDLFDGDHLDGTVLLGDVQAHDLVTPEIEAANLVEGSQLFLLFQGVPHDPVGHDDAIVIAHRGASGERPEHTLAAYQLGIDMGADYVEPDLVLTRDGHLVARHDNVLDLTTDVADHPEFADRRTTKTVDGVEVTGWFSEDFTLAEIKTLRAVERIPQVRPDNAAFDGQFEIPTLEEILDLVATQQAATGRTIGVYPELKHYTHFRDELGMDMNRRLVRVLDAHGYDDADDAIFVQSFEVLHLRRLDRMTDVPIVQLIGGDGAPHDLQRRGSDIDYEAMTTPRRLRQIARYADGIGPSFVPRILTLEGGAALPGNVTSLVDDAHAAGLQVHPYTFRRENVFLPTNYQDDPLGWFRFALSTGIDGFFTDNPDLGVAATQPR